MAIRTFNSDPNGTVDVHGYKGTITVTYDGAVLNIGEHNWYDDSDFWADVWTGTEVTRVTYGTTRGWTYGNSATVDATLAAREAAAKWYAARHLESLKAAAADRALEPAVGKSVKVVRGRKVPKGTEGTVIWVGEGRYYGPVPKYKNGWSTKPPMRIGLVDADGTKHWTDAKNVIVTDPENWVEDLADLEARAEWRGREAAGLNRRAA